MHKFELSRKELDNTSQLIHEIELIQKKLVTIMDQADMGFQDVLARTGKTEWVIRDERLQQVIQRFTIFSHKKLAADLAGFEVESGVKAGEVTLF
jgi:hypothetical protein